MPVTWGKNGAVYDWYDPFSNANNCTGQSDNTISYYTFNRNEGSGWNGGNRIGGPDNQAWVWGGNQSLSDQGMGGVIGIGVVNVKRDSPSSRYGNVGVKILCHFTKASNNGSVPYPDTSLPNDWQYTDNDNGYKYKVSSFLWRRNKIVNWGPFKAYAFLWPENYKINIFANIDDFVSQDFCSWPGTWGNSYLGNTFFPSDGDKAINSGASIGRELQSNTSWPRLFWNKRGQAGAKDINSVSEPSGHNADGVMNHTKMTVGITGFWNGSGPRAGHEYRMFRDFYAIIYVPDIPPNARNWIYPPANGGWGPGSTYIQLGNVTETSIHISSYGTTMPHQNNMMGYNDNNGPGRFRIQGSRVGNFIDCPPGQSRSASWNVTGLNPDTVYCFYTYAEANPASYGDKSSRTSPQACRRTFARPSKPENLQWSKWDTARVKIMTPYWGNDISYPTNASNNLQVVDYVFNNSPTDTSNYSTTNRINGNPGIVVSWTKHSMNQNTSFWIHSRTRNAWGASDWVHTQFETVDRLYRPGQRFANNWKSHQAIGGKSHRFVNSWKEMTTRSEFRPDGITQHVDDPPYERSGDRMHPEDPNKWRNTDLVGNNPSLYPEDDFYP